MLFVRTQEYGGCSHYVNLAQVTEVKVYRGGKHDGLVELHFPDGAARTIKGKEARLLVRSLEAGGLLIGDGNGAAASSQSRGEAATAARA